MVKWSSETHVYSRAIYTFWDLLGDVGGLFDMLKLIGQAMIAFITSLSGSKLNRVLISQIFYLPNKKKQDQSVWNHIWTRKHLKPRTCNMFLNRKNYKLHQNAEQRIQKHLDVVHIIKHSIIGEIVEKLQFKKLERLLLRHQTSGFVIINGKQHTDDVLTS